MRILTVIPISRGIAKDSLTYFTSLQVPTGSLVSIPLRNKTTYGLVTGSREAQELKSELKTLTYNIKKIENIETKLLLSPSFIKSTEEIADYNASSVGAVLSALIPKAILSGSGNLSFENKEAPKGIFHEIELLQSDDEERYATYRGLIREEFAKNRSVFFCLPTTEDLLNARAILEKGIENYTHVLHSGISQKELPKLWNKIIEDPHPVLIIATGSFLSLPRHDIGTIVVEKESSRAYKMVSRPFLDIRKVAQIVAKQKNVKLVLGDILLRTETLWEGAQNKTGSYSESSPLKFRSLATSVSELISMKSPADMKKKEFAIFSPKMKEMLQEAVSGNDHTFLFCGRKGLYPSTVCMDCGTVVVCKNCNAPVVLYGQEKNKTGKGGNLFVCNRCGERRSAEELCAYCGGWRLNPLGIGIDRAYEDLRSILPEAKIFVMDKEHVDSHKAAVKMRDLFYNTPGSIMLGTEMALTYLNEKVENAGVVSLDSYFSIPDFQINEKIFYILLSLRALSEKKLMVQTRQDNTAIFDYALRGNLMDFYRDEINDRKSIGYPPFTTYIKITLEGEKAEAKKEMLEVQQYLKPFDLNIFDAWNPGSSSKFTVHGLISMARGKWVNKDLLSKLRNLPQQYIVKIDPLTLL